MHISDGVLQAPIWVGGYVVAVAIAAATTKKIQPEDIPEIAITTSVFFVASLIHIPMGPTSVHLILNGLIGIILGPFAFVSIFLGLTLQALLFQHGGITTIGVNTLMMGLPALLAYKVFYLHQKIRFKFNVAIFGGIAGACGISLAAFILALLLITTGSEFIGVARLALLAHLPVIIIEAMITGFIVSFFKTVKPELLERRRR